jgi:sporulation protein YqfC
VYHLRRIYATLGKNITARPYTFPKGGWEMERNRLLLEKFTNATDLPDAPIPGLPLIELTGDARVLMENHCGVTEYGKERICVKVKFGQVCISGQELNLAKMTKNQLVICGRIQSVELFRGCR